VVNRKKRKSRKTGSLDRTSCDAWCPAKKIHRKIEKESRDQSMKRIVWAHGLFQLTERNKERIVILGTCKFLRAKKKGKADLY
jgi:hypothetical protein